MWVDSLCRQSTTHKNVPFCTIFLNFIIIKMHICRNPRTYVLPTRRGKWRVASKKPYKRDNILQKRPIVLRSPIEASSCNGGALPQNLRVDVFDVA